MTKKKLCPICEKKEIEESEDECSDCFDAYAEMRWREGAADAYGDDDE